MYLLALNCGSSSIKGKLYALPDKDSKKKDKAAQPGDEDKTHTLGNTSGLEPVAKLSVSNIGAKGDNVRTQVKWYGKAEDVDVEGDEGEGVKHRDMFPEMLKHLAEGGVESDEIKYITHRIVHGGTNKEPLVVSSGHSEALEGMDALSAFAPLHNQHAILGVRVCLDELPKHTSLLVFDTLFHKTLAPEVYTYALPPPTEDLPMPLRKYGFHGLSYASVLYQLAEFEHKPTKEMNLVIAHLGSGASACCILHGESVDTSMGLTPLEGLVGGTRTGTIDPTAIFHHTPDYWKEAPLKDMKVTKAEWIMNKKSGLTALAGTQNFGIITKRLDPETCSKEEHERAKLAYGVFVDRLMAHISQYLCKLLASVPLADVRLVFAGGIGEHSAFLRAEVLKRLAWIGATIGKNKDKIEEPVTVLSGEDSKLKTYVVQTDEEGWGARLARERFGF